MANDVKLIQYPHMQPALLKANNKTAADNEKEIPIVVDASTKQTEEKAEVSVQERLEKILGKSFAKLSNEEIAKLPNDKKSEYYRNQALIKKTEANPALFKKYVAIHLRGQLADELSKQGPIGAIWNSIKNTFAIGSSSDDAIDKIDKLENGDIQAEDALNAVNDFKEGQADALDMTADIMAGAVSLPIYIGSVAAAPFSGGTSIAAGLVAATASASAIKTSLKYADAKIGNRTYDTFGYDVATGGFSGILAPVTGGLGGLAGKTVAKSMGVQATKEIAKLAVKESSKKATMSFAKNILFNPTGYKYIGGTTLKRSLAFGTECAVDGATCGALDNMHRALWNGDNVAMAGLKGFAGGLALAPILGTSIKGIGELSEATLKRLSIIADNSFVSKLSKGTNGVIRGTDAIDSNDIVRLFNIKMKVVDADDINTIISKLLPEDKELGIKILKSMGQFADINGLDGLHKELTGINMPILNDSQYSTLSDILTYVSSKKALPENIIQNVDNLKDGLIKTLQEKGKAALILDDNMLNIIRNNKELIELIKNNGNIKLLVLDGWHNGINMFNTVDTQQIEHKFQSVLAESYKYAKAHNISPEQAVDKVLNKDMMANLEQLGLNNNVTIIKNNNLLSTCNTYEDIAKMYSYSQLSEENLAKILSEYDEEQQNALLEILARTSRPSSMKSLAARTTQQAKYISSLAKSKHIKKENIYYLVPTVEVGQGKKSYGVISMLHKEVNNIPDSQFINNISDIPDMDKSMVVILDDFSGSGKSLIDNYRALRNPESIIEEKVAKKASKLEHLSPAEKDKYISDTFQEELGKESTDVVPYNNKKIHYTGEIVIAPLSATSGANSSIDNFAEYLAKDSMLHFNPAEEIPLFFDSKYFDSLPLEQKQVLREVVTTKDGFERFDPTGDKASKWKSPNDIGGYYGFRGNATSIVFPYMAPNNNNSFFSTFIAPLLTLNSAGVKNRFIKTTSK